MKIRISYLWLCFLPLLFLKELQKTIFFMFFMLSIHECGHMLVAKCFHYKIEKVIIYPFGLCAQIQHMGKGNIMKELLIVLAGPMTHFIFPIVFLFLNQQDLISSFYLQYLLQMNQAIVIFNLLPIYPLDGGRILQAVFHFLFRYKLAQRITYCTSAIVLFLFVIFQVVTTYSANVVCLFLAFQLIIAWKQIPFDLYAFYQYRQMYPNAYPMKSNAKKDLFRAFYNMMKVKEQWIMEEEWLKIKLNEMYKKGIKLK